VPRYLHSLALLLLACSPLLSAHAQDEVSSPVVEGTLVGHDGSALPTSHFHVLPYDDERVRSIAVGMDRSFRAPLDTSGVVTLRFTGRNHEMESATVLVSPGDTIGVDVRLGTFPAQDSLDLKVFGTFNDFSYREETIPMQRRNDGTYAATVPSPGDSLTYGVLGTPPDGTQIDDLAYAGDGDYRPVVATPQDSTEIVYDPAAVPRSDAELTVNFRDANSTAAEYARFTESLERRQEAFREAMRSVEEREERKAISDTFDWSPSKNRLDDALETERPSEVKNAYRAAYLTYARPDSTVAKEALATIPASSPLWAMGRAFRRALYSTGDPGAHEAFIYEMLRKNPSDDVKPGALMTLLQQAAQKDQEEKQKLLFAWMESEYSDTPPARIARARYAPDRTIQVGKPVPDFEVAALQDTTKTFTTASFEGMYVLLDFWATWCGPCIEELPTLQTADSTYGDGNFTILSLSFDDARSTVTEFLEDRDMPWKHAFVEGGFRSEVADQFEVAGIPKPILIGPDGEIVATEADLRGEALLKTLDEHLGTDAGTATTN